MATETLSPVPKLQFFDNNGMPLVGGKLFTYSAGSSTKRATYVDSTGVTPNSNPIILDYRGEANVWIPPNVAYKYVLARSTDTDPPGAPIWSVDNVVNQQLLTLYGGIDSGSANAYVLNYTANFTAYTDGTVIYWIPDSTNTGASTMNVNGLGIVSIVQQNGQPLLAGMIQANQVVQIMYSGGSFILLAPTEGFFVGTLTGVTTTVTGNIYWSNNGSAVTLILPSSMSGTSNSANCTITGLPSALWPLSISATVPVALFSDNSVLVNTVVVTVTPAGELIFGLAQSSGGFTAGGVKGLGVNSPVTYLLR